MAPGIGAKNSTTRMVNTTKGQPAQDHYRRLGGQTGGIELTKTKPKSMWFFDKTVYSLANRLKGYRKKSA
jgi:hypothetical protein